MDLAGMKVAARRRRWHESGREEGHCPLAVGEKGESNGQPRGEKKVAGGCKLHGRVRSLQEQKLFPKS